MKIKTYISVWLVSCFLMVNIPSKAAAELLPDLDLPDLGDIIPDIPDLGDFLPDLPDLGDFLPDGGSLDDLISLPNPLELIYKENIKKVFPHE
ncbi:MAG: hypothetical protein F6K24_14110 [Okeania sp. SIO2D1]|nr:hypothetical protein [Okeania sp. SIO2D1]